MKKLHNESGNTIAKYDGGKFTVCEDAALLQEVEDFVVNNHPSPGQKVEVELVEEMQEFDNESFDWEDELDNYLLSYK